MELLLIILFAAILGAAALAFGVDSTDASTDPQAPIRPTGITA
jgi:hypothetical protein